MDDSMLPTVHYYYVDEAGDGVLFSSKGGEIVGTQGCSKYFILGALEVDTPIHIEHRLSELRSRLLNDPYFKSVPSMQPESHKTALFFHAKDDVPEVRRDVFSVLRGEYFKFYALVLDKRALVNQVRELNRQTKYHYRIDHLYDLMVMRLFHGLIDGENAYHIYFAKRENNDRTTALKRALMKSKKDQDDQNLKVTPCLPWDHDCLQAVDYLLWATYRFYERAESRYLDLFDPSLISVKVLEGINMEAYLKE